MCRTDSRSLYLNTRRSSDDLFVRHLSVAENAFYKYFLKLLAVDHVARLDRAAVFEKKLAEFRRVAQLHPELALVPLIERRQIERALYALLDSR